MKTPEEQWLEILDMEWAEVRLAHPETEGGYVVVGTACPQCSALVIPGTGLHATTGEERTNKEAHIAWHMRLGW